MYVCMYVCKCIFIYIFLFFCFRTQHYQRGRTLTSSLTTWTDQPNNRQDSLQDLCLRNIIWFSNRKICVALKRAVLNLSAQTVAAYLALCLEVFFGKRTAWMLGRTPPCAMVTPERSLFNSSSLRIANCK